MGAPQPTKSQVERDQFLRSLAVRPGEALRHWPRLNMGERSVVVTYMKLFYDTEFAILFFEKATRGRRPDLLIEITNDPDRRLTHQSLTSAGYRVRKTDGSVTIWAHPGGKEIWILPAPRAAPLPASSPPTPGPQAAPSTSPLVEEAHSFGDEIKKEWSSLVAQVPGLKARSGQPGYYAEWGRFWNQIGDIGKRIDTLIEDLTSDASSADLTASEKSALTRELDRLNSLKIAPAEIWQVPTPPEAEEKMRRAAQQTQATP